MLPAALYSNSIASHSIDSSPNLCAGGVAFNEGNTQANVENSYQHTAQASCGLYGPLLVVSKDNASGERTKDYNDSFVFSLTILDCMYEV
ncbi:MAG: hypothetical protein M3040_11045 [Bacteroidota bacterium]|nr:hypothetical protein [Bacteroidota bacterium]